MVPLRRDLDCMRFEGLNPSTQSCS
jgi:hypothetical protein